MIASTDALSYGSHSSEKVHSNMRNMRRFNSSCACAKYYPGICSPFIHSLVFNDLISGQRRPDAQSDLDFRCPHMPEDKVSHGATNFVVTVRNDAPNPVRPSQIPM